MKKIMILNGAGRRNGSTATLVKAFIEGAGSSGNEVKEFFLQEMNIHGCIGCNVCSKDGGNCIQHDDMELIYSAFEWADVVVFASPVYWGSITGTLKTTADRLYAMLSRLKRHGFAKEGILLMTAGSPIYDQALMWYSGYSRYNGWKNLGIVLGQGKSAEAKKLGASIN